MIKRKESLHELAAHYSSSLCRFDKTASNEVIVSWLSRLDYFDFLRRDDFPLDLRYWYKLAKLIGWCAATTTGQLVYICNLVDRSCDSINVQILQ